MCSNPRIRPSKWDRAPVGCKQCYGVNFPSGPHELPSADMQGRPSIDRHTHTKCPMVHAPSLQPRALWETPVLSRAKEGEPGVGETEGCSGTEMGNTQEKGLRLVSGLGQVQVARGAAAPKVFFFPFTV